MLHFKTREGRGPTPYSAIWPLCRLTCIALLLIITSCTPWIQPPTAANEAQLIVQIHYPSVEALNQLASTLDIWEVERSAQTLVAKVSFSQYDQLLAQGLPVALDCTKMRQYADALRTTQSPRASVLLLAQCP
jgi:hypothetical protein